MEIDFEISQYRQELSSRITKTPIIIKQRPKLSVKSPDISTHWYPPPVLIPTSISAEEAKKLDEPSEPITSKPLISQRPRYKTKLRLRSIEL